MRTGEPFRDLAVRLPWLLYLVIGTVLAEWATRAWRWRRHRQILTWPTADARIDSVRVRRGFPSGYVAKVRYSYLVVGPPNQGTAKREFIDRARAEEFARHAQGKLVSIRHHPENPAKSSLPDEAIDAVLASEAGAAHPLPRSLSHLLPALARISAIGLVLSLLAHLGTVSGRFAVPAVVTSILTVGIFVVWFPAGVVLQYSGTANWELVLRRSPGWMRYMVYAFLAYCALDSVVRLAMGRSPDPGPFYLAADSAALAVLSTCAALSQPGGRGS